MLFPFFDTVFMFTWLLVSSGADWWEFLFPNTRRCFGVPQIFSDLLQSTMSLNIFSDTNFILFLILEVKLSLF